MVVMNKNIMMREGHRQHREKANIRDFSDLVHRPIFSEGTLNFG